MSDKKVAVTYHTVLNWKERIPYEHNLSDSAIKRVVKEIIPTCTKASTKTSRRASRFFSVGEYRETRKTPDPGNGTIFLVSQEQRCVFLCKEEVDKIIVISVASFDNISETNGRLKWDKKRGTKKIMTNKCKHKIDSREFAKIMGVVESGAKINPKDIPPDTVLGDIE